MMTPDTKNWTWVLERRCEDCGFDTRSVSRGDLAGWVRRTVEAWVRVLGAPDVRLRRDPEVWSPLEYGCHVRDVYRRFDERVRLIVTEDDPAFENWDQDATAIQDRYSAQEPTEVARQLVAAGEALAARFEAVASDAWGRTGRRSDGSTFTTETLGRYLVHDPVHHLWDVGRPIV